MDEIVDYAAGHQRYGVFLVNSGRSDEGLRELKRALELDPASLPINAEKAYTERVPFLRGLKVGRPWDGLRTDPRFTDLLKRIGLTP